ncbi:MAG: type II toxin-antitoxin system Phd/YefM family antitoxin [Candidatus Xenobiia bacterium LiM19]
MKEVSISEGKRDFTALLSLSEKGESITVVKRKRPVAVIVPHGEYQKMMKILHYLNMKEISEELKGGSPPLAEILDESRRELENGNADGS